MTSPSTQNFGKSIFRNWRYAIGWLLAAAGLIWVLHDIHLSKLAGQLAGINWRWVALAMVCDLLAYIVQGVRWQLLLQPVGKISLLQATQAIYAGLFTFLACASLVIEAFTNGRMRKPVRELSSRGALPVSRLRR